MRILLLYPEYPDTFWSLKYALKFINKKAVMPPLGLLTIASILEKDNELRLIDMNINTINDDDILWADYVFISAMITQKISADMLIQRCKKLGAKIVAGGPLFNNLYQNYPEIDHFIINEGEITIPLLLEDLKKGNPQKIYNTDKRPDITTVPIPKWDLINFEDYAKMPVQTARGCPFDCEFCDIVSLNGRDYRMKPVQQVIKEMDVLYNKGWRGSMIVVDDNFIGNKERTKLLLKELISWKREKAFRGSFMTQVSLNIATDEELLNLMKDAGFHSVFIGIESPAKECLEECQKVQNKNRDMVKDVKKIHSFGIEVLGGFIVGFDNDDEAIFERQYEFIQEAGIVVATIGILNALPGTKLYHRLKNENRLLNESTGNNTDGSINFVTKMDSNLLLREYKKLVKSIYSVENYYQRIFNFLKEYNHYSNSKLNFNFFVAFLKSLYILGITDKNRLYFWKLFFLTLFKYPKSLSKALTQAIYYVHFEKITQLECQSFEF